MIGGGRPPSSNVGLDQQGGSRLAPSWHTSTTPRRPRCCPRLWPRSPPSSGRSATPRRCTRPAARAPRRRGVPRAGRRVVRRPAERGGLHRRRHRGRQPGGQGPVLGAQRLRAPPAEDHRQPGRAPRRARPARWLAEHEGAEVVWLPVDGSAESTRRRRLGARRGPRVGRARHRDVGQQRGRHGPAGQRAGRRGAAPRRPGAHRRGAGGRPARRSTSRPAGSTR